MSTIEGEPKIPTTDETVIKEEPKDVGEESEGGDVPNSDEKENVADIRKSVKGEIEDSENDETDQGEDEFKKTLIENDSEEINDGKLTIGQSTNRPPSTTTQSSDKDQSMTDPASASELSEKVQSIRKSSAKDQSMTRLSSATQLSEKGQSIRKSSTRDQSMARPSSASPLSEEGQSIRKSSAKDQSMTRLSSATQLSEKGQSTRKSSARDQSSTRPSSGSQLSEKGQSIRKSSAKDQSILRPSSAKKSSLKAQSIIKPSSASESTDKDQSMDRPSSTTSQLSYKDQSMSKLSSSVKNSLMTRPSTRKTTRQSDFTPSREDSNNGSRESLGDSARSTKQSFGSRGPSSTKSTLKLSQGPYQKTTVDGGSAKSSMKNSLGSRITDNFDDDEIEEDDYLNGEEEGEDFYGDDGEGDGEDEADDDDNLSYIISDSGSGIKFDDDLIESKSGSKKADKLITFLEWASRISVFVNLFLAIFFMGCSYFDKNMICK